VTVAISVKHNFADVQRQLEQLRDDVGAHALASAVNKTMDQAKTSMSTEIRAEFNISATKVRAALVVKHASFRNGTLAVEASLESPTKRGRSINLINFDPKKTPTGLSFKIKKAGGRVNIPGAFIGNQGRTVFIRMPGTTMSSRAKYAGSKHAQAIDAMQTIDVGQMFNTKRINAKVVQFIQTKFPALFEHEAKFYTDRFNARRAV
jgi:hypothetical protein